MAVPATPVVPALRIYHHFFTSTLLVIHILHMSDWFAGLPANHEVPGSRSALVAGSVEKTFYAW